jgi:hypothetical protein
MNSQCAEIAGSAFRQPQRAIGGASAALCVAGGLFSFGTSLTDI